MFFNISTSFPQISFPTEIEDVGRAFGGGKLSPVIPDLFALCGPPSGQKNFYPTYPRVTRRFPLSYPRKSAPARIDVENPGDNAGKSAKKYAQ